MPDNSGVWIRIACDPCDGTGVRGHERGDKYYETACDACEGTGVIDGLADDYDDSQWVGKEVSQ